VRQSLKTNEQHGHGDRDYSVVVAIQEIFTASRNWKGLIINFLHRAPEMIMPF
jgi:hypothetical protein